MAVPFFLLLPLFHAFNPLSIASLVRVVAGLNRCGSFRIQQQAFHSGSGFWVRSSDQVPRYYCYSVNIGHGIRRGASFLFRSIKLNVSLRACAAFNRYIKITKNSEISKSAQSPVGGWHCRLSGVYDVGMSIASTSVMPEHGHRCRCKVRVCTRTPICSQSIAHPAAKFRHTPPDVVRRFVRPIGVGS